MKDTDSFSNLSFRVLYKRLSASVLTYGTGMILATGAQLILLPVFLRYLTPAEYGVWALTRVVAPFFASVLSLDLSGAIIRLYYEWKKEGREKEALFSLWMFTLAWGGVMTILLAWFGERLFALIFTQLDFNPFIRLAILAEGINLTSLLVLKVLRIKDQARSFAWLNFIQVLITMLLTIYFVAFLRQGVIGALYGVLIANAVMLVIFSAVMMRNSRARLDVEALKEALRYSVPLVPGNIVNNVSNVLDRWFLDKVVPLQEIGLYSVARTIANLLTAVFSAFQLAVMPFLVKVSIERDDHREIAGKTFFWLFSVLVLCAFTVSTFAPETLLILGRDAYLESYIYVGPLAFAFMLSSFSFLPEFQITMSKKTKYTSVIYGLRFLIFALLGSILVLNYGIAGVLLTYVATNGLALVAHMWIGHRLHPIDSGILGWVVSAFLAVVLYSATAYLLPVPSTIDVATVVWKTLVLLLLAGLIILTSRLRSRHVAVPS